MALVSESPERPECRDILARQWHNLGLVLVRMRRVPEAEEACREAIRIHAELVKTHPESPEYARNLAKHYTALGELLQQCMRLHEAEQVGDLSVRLLNGLCESHPREPAYLADLANAYCVLAPARNATQTIKELHAVISRLEELVATDNESVPEHKARLGQCYSALGDRLAETGGVEEAAKAYRRAIAMFESLTSDYPQLSEYQGDLALAFGGLAEILVTRGDLAEAKDTLDRAVACERAAPASGSEKRERRPNLTQHGLIVMILMRQGNLRAAAVAARELIQQPCRSAASAYDTARLLARCAGLAEEHKDLPDDNQRETGFDYASGAIQMLHLAVKLGLQDIAILKDEKDFETIRDHPEFAEIVEQLVTVHATEPRAAQTQDRNR